MGKYGNKKTIVDNIPFDSKAEAARYQELKLLEKAGEIRNLQLQPRFELVPKLPCGERAAYYTADFSYRDMTKGNKLVVEDVKGYKQETSYVLRRKLFKWRNPDIIFREV